MFLKKTPTRYGRVSLSFVKGFRVNGKNKQKTIKTIGFLDDLEKIYPDPIAHFTAEAKRITEEENAKTVSHYDIKVFPEQKISDRTANRKNVGSAVITRMTNDLLIERPIRNSTAAKAKQFSVSSVLRLMICERLLNPGSKLSDWQDKDSYFFKTDFSYDDIYRSLDILADLKSNIISSMNNSIDRMGLRDKTDKKYYDVTNYYFEIDDTDDLRKLGVSKEHRKSPIVQMSLLQDANGIPITYKLFGGNTNDCLTLIPVLEDVKKEQNISRVVVVADKGLNTSDNIAANVAKGNGFIFSQSIKGTKSKQGLKKWVTSDIGYRHGGKDGFKIKSKIDNKTVHLKPEDTFDGKAKHIDIPVKVVAFYSEKCAIKARCARASAISKAEDMVRRPGLYNKASSYGAAKYVKDVKFDVNTGEIINKHALSFDEEKLREEEACDGYYCIVTSEVEMSDNEIIDAYKNLWRIEEGFKISKSHLKSRPVFVRTPKHIEAHFLTCYISLTVARLLQFKCKNHYSIEQILGTLKKQNCSNIDENYWLFNYVDDASRDLFEMMDLKHPSKFMELGEIKKLFSARK